MNLLTILQHRRVHPVIDCSWVARLVSGGLAEVLFVRLLLANSLCKRYKGQSLLYSAFSFFFHPSLAVLSL